MAQTRRRFSKEFKAEVVKLVVASGKSVAEVARAHEIADSVVASWVRQGRIDAGQGPAGALTTEERAELAALRKACRELRMERDFLKNNYGLQAGRLWLEKLCAMDGLLSEVAGCTLVPFSPLKNMVRRGSAYLKVVRPLRPSRLGN